MTESDIAELPANAIIILSTPGCYRCGVVEKHLTAKRKKDPEGTPPFFKIDVTEEGPFRQAMQDAGFSSVPRTLRLCDIGTPDEWVDGVDFDSINRLW